MTRRLAVLLAALLLAPACSPGASEGASCDRANGNDDCKAGLVCTAAIDLAASSSRCCPRPPDKPTTSGCAPAGQGYQPDPSVPPYSSGGSTGSGGTAGSGGTGGTAGSAGAGGSDAGSAGTAGTAGSDAGSAGAGGSGGSSTDAGGG